MGAFAGFVPQDSDERKIIEKITTFKDEDKYSHDLIHFYNLLFDPVRIDGVEQYEGFYLATNVLRKEVGLTRKGRPGDYDIIFIPYVGDYLFYDRTAVYEVKIVRPNFKHPNRSSNSLGETQVYGLLEDGFPLVGLLHIVIAEPLLPDQMSTIRVSKVPAGDELKPTDPPLPPLEELFEEEPLDWLPWYSVDKQMARLISAGFPKYVGLDAFSITKNTDGTHSVMTSQEWRGYRSGYFNPNKSKELMNCLKNHFEQYGESRYRKLKLFNRK